MAKKQHHEEHENHERWLVSWADFMTLLFALFVVMYAVSKVDTKKLNDAATSIKFAMHFKGSGGIGELPIFEGPVSVGGCVANVGGEGRPGQADKELIDTIRKRIDRRIKRFIQSRPELKNAAVTLQLDGRRLGVRLSAAHFFDPSQAAIRPEMLPILDSIATELVPLKRLIRIEGHTDDMAVKGQRFRDNWDLSGSRAAAVASYVQAAHKVEGTLLAAVGHGATRPIAKNDSPVGREANRRIEMVIELKPGDSLDALGR